MTTVQRLLVERRQARLDPSFHFRRMDYPRLLEDDGVRYVTVEDVVSRSHEHGRLSAAMTDVPLVRLSDLRECELDLSGLQRVDHRTSRSLAQAGPRDVLVAQSAARFRAAVVPDDAPQPLAVSPEIMTLRTLGAVEPAYLATILSTRPYDKILRDLSYRRSPTALQRLRSQDIRDLPIPLPGRGQQQEIRAAYESAARFSRESREEISSVVRAVHAEIDIRVRRPRLVNKQLVIRRSQLGERWDVGYAKGRLFRASLVQFKEMVPLLSLARAVPSSLRGIAEDDLVLCVKADDINESSFLVERPSSNRLSELSSRMRQPLSVGDVLLCTTGEGEQIAYLDESLAAPGLPLLGSATFTALRFAETPRFYAVALAHPLVREQLRRLSLGSVQRFVAKRDLDDVLVPSLGSVWREDFDIRTGRAIERRREALVELDRLLATAERFVRGGWPS